jgi:hypothetical protein
MYNRRPRYKRNKNMKTSDNKLPDWNAYYLQGAKQLKTITNPYHIDISITGEKPNGRRAMNLDIYLEAGTPPLKYVTHMVPYSKKYEVFANMPEKQSNWPGWDTIKQQFADYRDNAVQYGKCQHRARNTKVLARVTVPHCASGIYLDNADNLMAHVLLFDKEYVVECENETREKASKIFVARGSITNKEDPPLLDID